MKRRKYKYVLLFVDWLVVNLAFLLAVGPQLSALGSGVLLSDVLVRTEFLLFVVYSPVVLYLFQSNQLYRLNIHMTITEQAKKVLKCLIIASIGLALALLTIGEGWMANDGQIVVLYFFGYSLLLVGVERIIVMRTLFKLLVRFNLSKRFVLVIGACAAASQVGRALGRKNALGLSLVGFLDDEYPLNAEVLPGARVLGRIDDVEKVVRETRADEILLCLEGLPEERYLGLLETCSKTKARLMVGSEQFSVITKHIYNEDYGGMPVFGVMNSAPYLGAPILKRLGDILLAAFGIVLVSPIMAILAVAIKLDSPGPVLFKQVRIGKDGKPFTFLKFRSMVVGSDNDKERVKKLEQFIKHDKTDVTDTTKIVDVSRITRIGRFIRRSSLDELPQLFNVLVGDMSLVGPRPCLPYEWANYSEWHKRRLSVTPGCTGVWQVFGRSKVGFRESVIIDLFYAQNMSFRLDLWLVLKTIPVMFFGSGGK